MIYSRIKWNFLLEVCFICIIPVFSRSAFESSNPRTSGRLSDTTTEIPSKEADLKTDSNFNCLGRPSGHYADIGSGCTVFYYCDPSGMKSQFKCPRLNLFHQKYNVCDWNFNVKCEESEKYYPTGEGVVNKNIQEFDTQFGTKKKKHHKIHDEDEEVDTKPKSKNSYEEEYEEPEEEIKPKNIKSQKEKTEIFKGRQPFDEENDEDEKTNQENDYKNIDTEMPKPGFPSRPPSQQDFKSPFGRPTFKGFPSEEKVQLSAGRPSFQFVSPRKDFGQKPSFATLIENRQSQEFDDNEEKSEGKPSLFSSDSKSGRHIDEEENWDKNHLKSGSIVVTSNFRKAAPHSSFRQDLEHMSKEELSTEDESSDFDEHQEIVKKDEFHPSLQSQNAFQENQLQNHFIDQDKDRNNKVGNHFNLLEFYGNSQREEDHLHARRPEENMGRLMDDNFNRPQEKRFFS